MRLRSRVARFSVILALTPAILLALDLAWSDRGAPRPPTEIFTGITYGRERIEPTAEGGGMLHWARIDLSAPGIGLYVTPLDRNAVARGWQYRLRRVGTVAEREHLALAVNAMLRDRLNLAGVAAGRLCQGRRNSDRGSRGEPCLARNLSAVVRRRVYNG